MRYTITGKLEELSVVFDGLVCFVLQGDTGRLSMKAKYQRGNCKLKFLTEGRLNAAYENNCQYSFDEPPRIKLSALGLPMGRPIAFTLSDLGRPCVNQLVNGKDTILTVNSIDVKLSPTTMLGEVTFAYSEDEIDD